MAGKACCFGVAATQRELGFLVIKSCYFFPAVDDVASFAFIAKIAFVGLAVGVAGKASVRGFAEFLAGYVALFACDGFMAALQSKFCFGMIEDNGLELDQLMI